MCTPSLVSNVMDAPSLATRFARRSLDDFRKENISFEKVEKLSPHKVYSGGCLRELVRLMPALQRQRPVSKALLVASGVDIDIKEEVSGGGLLNTNVLYLGDSLFADLVDAKRGKKRAATGTRQANTSQY